MKIGIDFLADRLGQSGCIGFHRNFIKWVSRLAEEEKYYIFVYKSEFEDYKKYICPEKEDSVVLISMGSERTPLWKRILDQQVRIPLHFRRLGIDRAFSDNIIPIRQPPRIKWIFRVLIALHFYKGLDINRLRRAYRIFTTRHAVRKAFKILPNSFYTLSELKKFCRIRTQRVVVIGEAYDSEVFYPVEKDTLQDRLRSMFGLEKRYLLQVSSYVNHKNPIVSMKVLAALRRQGFDLDLVLVGSDPQGNRDKYLAIARHLGINGNLHLLPFQLPDKLRLLYNGAECFLYPSAWETFGIPPLEAMACGLPVIASNKSAVPEVVRDAGICVDPLNITEFTSAVRRVLEDGGLRRRMVEQGFAHIQNFSWERIIGQIRGEILTD